MTNLAYVQGVCNDESGIRNAAPERGGSRYGREAAAEAKQKLFHFPGSCPRGKNPIFDSIKAKNPRRCEVLRFFLMPKNVAIYYYFFRVCRITFFMLKSVRIS